MTILVTGITGLIGSAIGTHLLATGYEVIGLSRRYADLSCTRSVQLELGTDGLVDQVARAVPRCDGIVHAAASLDMKLAAPAISLVNCLGSQQVVELSARWGRVRIVNVSSLGVIGTPRILPINEDHQTAPTTSYHASKLFGEHLMNVATDQGIPTVSLRVTAPIGPAMPSNRILPVFIRRSIEGQPLDLAGQGSRRQDYVDVRDIATAAAACLDRPKVCGVLNIGSGHSISNLELARLCIRLCHSASEIRFSGAADPEEPLTWDVSIDRAKRTIDYFPKFELEDTIQGIADSYAGRHSQ